jgi:Family of unknown function (DUF5681)
MATEKQLAALRPFKPGQSGNPGGKPAGTRNRLTAKFLNALADDFDEHGAAAIEACRQNDPAAYIRVIVALCPKEMEVKRPLDELTDDDIANLIAILSSPDAARAN